MNRLGEVAKAWLAAWPNELTPGQFVSDETEQGQALPTDPDIAMPYAVLRVTQQSKPKWGHRFRTDFVEVKVELYGLDKDDVAQLCEDVHDAMDWPRRLTLPDGLYHAYTRNSESESEEPTAEKRRGQHVRLATLTWVVLTHSGG